MTKSRNRRRGWKRYDRAGVVVLSSVELGHAPISLNKLRWKQRGLWMLLILALAGAAVGVWLTLDARFYVYDAQIVGNRQLSHQEIFAASGLHGLHVLWARSPVVESRIAEALPAVESVEATCRLPSMCSIAVVERRPRVLWDDGSGDLWWVDEEGAIFPVRAPSTSSGQAPSAGSGQAPSAGSGQAPSAGSGQGHGTSDTGDRWEVSGPLTRDDSREEAYLDEQVRVGLAELWESGRDLPNQFQYSREQGLSFVDGHGWRIIVGQGPGMALRLRVLDRLTAFLEWRGVTPRFVDVRFPEAPYYVPAADQGGATGEAGYAGLPGALSERGLELIREPL